MEREICREKHSPYKLPYCEGTWQCNSFQCTSSLVFLNYLGRPGSRLNLPSLTVFPEKTFFRAGFTQEVPHRWKLRVLPSLWRGMRFSNATVGRKFPNRRKRLEVACPTAVISIYAIPPDPLLLPGCRSPEPQPRGAG